MAIVEGPFRHIVQIEMDSTLPYCSPASPGVQPSEYTFATARPDRWLNFWHLHAALTTYSEGDIGFAYMSAPYVFSPEYVWVQRREFKEAEMSWSDATGAEGSCVFRTPGTSPLATYSNPDLVPSIGGGGYIASRRSGSAKIKMYHERRISLGDVVDLGQLDTSPVRYAHRGPDGWELSGSGSDELRSRWVNFVSSLPLKDGFSGRNLSPTSISTAPLPVISLPRSTGWPNRFQARCDTTGDESPDEWPSLWSDNLNDMVSSTLSGTFRGCAVFSATQDYSRLSLRWGHISVAVEPSRICSIGPEGISHELIASSGLRAVEHGLGGVDLYTLDGRLLPTLADISIMGDIVRVRFPTISATSPQIFADIRMISAGTMSRSLNVGPADRLHGARVKPFSEFSRKFSVEKYTGTLQVRIDCRIEGATPL